LQPLRLPRRSPAGFAALARSTTTTTAAGAASATGEAPTAAMSATLYLRAGLVDVQCAATEIKPIQGGNSAFRLG
jgi:hypothetical protein